MVNYIEEEVVLVRGAGWTVGNDKVDTSNHLREDKNCSNE